MSDDPQDRIDDLQILDELQPSADPPEVNTDERPLTLREQVFADIVRKRREALLGDQEEQPEEAVEPPAHEPVHVEAEEHRATVVHPAPPTEPTPPQHAPSQVVTLPNGLQVTADQALTLAHMGFVAAQAMTQPMPQSEAAPVHRPVVDDSLLADTVHKMQFGSPDEGKAALGHLIQQVAGNIPQQPVIDPRQVAAEATQVVRAHLRLEQDAAAVRSEFPEIFDATHPERAQEAHAWVEALRLRDQRLGRSRSDLDIYREAGSLVYNQHNLSRPGSEQTTAPQAAQPSVQPRADVEERKRAAPRNPQAVSRRAVQPEPPRQPTGSETIAAMRSMYRRPALP